MNNYLFTSLRLGFRIWDTESDCLPFATMNQDEHVMKFFPRLITKQESLEFIIRMQQMFDEKGYCYFAVDLLETGEFLGFIGLAYQTFETPFSPFIDIGWRLVPNAWFKGYATEGAKRCLEFGFMQKGLLEINAIAPSVNVPSIAVMQRIGMKKIEDFEHPKLLNNAYLRYCSRYSINRDEYLGKVQNDAF